MSNIQEIELALAKLALEDLQAVRNSAHRRTITESPHGYTGTQALDTGTRRRKQCGSLAHGLRRSLFLMAGNRDSILRPGSRARVDERFGNCKKHHGVLRPLTKGTGTSADGRCQLSMLEHGTTGKEQAGVKIKKHLHG